MDSGREDGIPTNFFRELQVQLLVHELKDPLAIVEAGARSLLEKEERFGPLSPRQKKTLQRVLRGALKGRSMLNNLLEIGRSEAGQFIRRSFFPARTLYTELLASIETMDGELFEQISDTMAEAEVLRFLNDVGISLQVAPEVSEIEIIQDEAKFSQIVGNLIKNALRFRKTRLEIKLFEERQMIVVEVIDDGPGIKQEEQADIFRSYVQTEQEASVARKGHGLGLAGALILAQRLGGDVSVQSELGKGAKFRFTVPST